MSGTTVARVSLWREARDAIKESYKIWRPWVLGFAGAIAVAETAVQFSARISGLDLSALKQDPSLLKEHPEIGIFGGLLVLVSVVTGILAVYIYTTVYLRHAVKTSPPEMNVKNFLFWFKKILCKVAIVFAPLLAAGVLMGLAKAAGFGADSSAFTFPAAIMLMGALCFILVTTVRLQLVTPLAVLRRDPVLKKSWNMTKGHWWRIFWGAFMIACYVGIMALLYLIVPMIVVGIGSYFLSDFILFDLVGSFLENLLSQAVSLGGCVFACTTYRVLLQEQKQAPSSVPATPERPAPAN